jgi:hypothetical protein
MKKPFTTAAVVVFALVALVHALRLAMAWEVVIGGFIVPLWFSGLGLLAGGVLAVMVWRETLG